jgi:hypothetical protein
VKEELAMMGRKFNSKATGVTCGDREPHVSNTRRQSNEGERKL